MKFDESRIFLHEKQEGEGVPSSSSRGEKQQQWSPNLKALSEFPAGEIWRTKAGLGPPRTVRDIALISAWQFSPRVPSGIRGYGQTGQRGSGLSSTVALSPLWLVRKLSLCFPLLERRRLFLAAAQAPPPFRKKKGGLETVRLRKEGNRGQLETVSDIFFFNQRFCRAVYFNENLWIIKIPRSNCAKREEEQQGRTERGRG